MLAVTVLSLCIAIVIGVGLYIKASPVLHEKSLFNLLGNSHWRPLRRIWFLSFYHGHTVGKQGIAISIYLSEYANQRWKRLIEPTVRYFSRIPPVVYGVWGILAIASFMSAE